MSKEPDRHQDVPKEGAEAVAAGERLDTAGRSLSEALRLSFMVLKVVMIVLIIAFLASGFKTIGSDEVGLLLRFGKFVPVGEDRVIGPGAKWVFPYPIDEVIKIPVGKKVNLPINSFWYYQTEAELLNEGPKRPDRVPSKLDPTKDGYTLTRGEKQDKSSVGSGDDYNIVHMKWQLTYQIDDAERFFRNVYIGDAKPGQVYFDVITNGVEALLRSIFEDAVVAATVNYTIEEVTFEQVARVTEHIKAQVKKKLDDIGSGIKVVSVQLTNKTWPRQVDDAFQQSVTVSQESQQAISEARTQAQNILNEAAGPITNELHKALGNSNMSEQEKEQLWSRLAGAAQEKIYQAQAYRTTVVKNAKANADYLQSLLPEYRKRPGLVLQRLYLEALERVFEKADEKIVIEPTDTKASNELRILINRDPTITRKAQPKTDNQQKVE
jgi:membrane protease subunit HflK